MKFDNLFKNKRKITLYEAFFSSLVVGLAETYFAAFALYKGVSVVESGLLVSLPLLFAGVTPFIFNKLFHKFQNSTWVQMATLTQVFSLASLAVLGLFRPDAIFVVLLIIFSIYWFGHFSALPSWNQWIAELIPLEDSHKYFSLRTRVIQIGILLGLLLGGVTLHLESFYIENLFIEKLKIPTALVFILIFLIAYHLKLLIFYLFYRLPESSTRYNLNIRKKFVFFKKKIHFFKVYSLFNFSLYLSAPYVAGYLLNIRGLSYFSFMYVMGAMFVGKIMTTIMLEKFRPNANPHKLFFYGGLLAAPLPILLPFCPNAFWLALVQFCSGIGWAGWEMGLALVIFKNIKADDKLEAVSLYNSIGLPVQVLGTIAGALLLKYVYFDNYSLMFIVAGVLRFIFILPINSKKFGD